MRILSNPFTWIAVLLFGGLVYWAYPFASTSEHESSVAKRESQGAMASDSKLNQVGTAESAVDLSSAHFLDSKNCALCHSNSDRATAMRDQSNRPIAPYDLWQASMMANSSRDPFWRAVLSAEVVATPSKKALIEEKCTRCHAPMAAPAPMSPEGDVLAYIKNQDERSHLGLDGVSCTVCHQITDKGLGTNESFTGHFEINKEKKIWPPCGSIRDADETTCRVHANAWQPYFEVGALCDLSYRNHDKCRRGRAADCRKLS